jgi:hypothetical protein
LIGSEDCLPSQGDIESIGASLAEFEILGYPETKQAYFIRCPECVGRFKRPMDEATIEWTKSWNQELAVAERKWDEKFNNDTVDQTTVKSETMESNFKSEILDLTQEDSVKMEGTLSTVTTEAEQQSCPDLGGIVSELHFGREVIVID